MSLFWILPVLIVFIILIIVAVVLGVKTAINKKKQQDKLNMELFDSKEE